MDDLVLNLLFSNDENNFKVTELFFSFLDFKQISVHVTPKLYKKILSKIPNTWEGQELKEYLRGHIINGKGLIGEGEESDREQMLSLAKSLVSVNDKVIIISDKYKKDEDLNSSIGERARIIRIDEFNNALPEVKHFWEYWAIKKLHIYMNYIPHII